MESPEWRTRIGSRAVRQNTPPCMLPYPIRALGLIVIYVGFGGSQHQVVHERHTPICAPPWALAQMRVQRRSTGAEALVCALANWTHLVSLGCIVCGPRGLKPPKVAISGGACDNIGARDSRIRIFPDIPSMPFGSRDVGPSACDI